MQEKIKQEIALLADNPRHPSLQSKQIHGAPGVYEAQAGIDYRLAQERNAKVTLALRVVQNHDEG